jgi:hypothetical protein
VPEAALLFAVSQEKGQLKKNNLGLGKSGRKTITKTLFGLFRGNTRAHQGTQMLASCAG